MAAIFNPITTSVVNDDITNVNAGIKCVGYH